MSGFPRPRAPAPLAADSSPREPCVPQYSRDARMLNRGEAGAHSAGGAVWQGFDANVPRPRTTVEASPSHSRVFAHLDWYPRFLSGPGGVSCPLLANHCFETLAPFSLVALRRPSPEPPAPLPLLFPPQTKQLPFCMHVRTSWPGARPAWTPMRRSCQLLAPSATLCRRRPRNKSLNSGIDHLGRVCGFAGVCPLGGAGGRPRPCTRECGALLACARQDHRHPVLQ